MVTTTIEAREPEEHYHFHALVFNLRYIYVMKFHAIVYQVNNAKSKNIVKTMATHIFSVPMCSRSGNTSESPEDLRLKYHNGFYLDPSAKSTESKVGLRTAVAVT